ncbi:MAG: hypothetical protein MUE85_16130 [Microscillaceae bacterium]|jgi:hypothetical protein|nr:hypothetical protein [Microscillaceae bacterium]
MTLLQLIQERGYQNWQSLAKDIKEADLGKTSSGYIYPHYIKSWLVYSVGASEEQANDIFEALRKMGYLVENSNGNIYP